MEARSGYQYGVTGTSGHTQLLCRYWGFQLRGSYLLIQFPSPRIPFFRPSLILSLTTVLDSSSTTSFPTLYTVVHLDSQWTSEKYLWICHNPKHSGCYGKWNRGQKFFLSELVKHLTRIMSDKHWTHLAHVYFNSHTSVSVPTVSSVYCTVNMLSSLSLSTCHTYILLQSSSSGQSMRSLKTTASWPSALTLNVHKTDQ